MILTLDFETEAISDIPTGIPPKPVGVSLKLDGKASKYYAFGHPTQNNCGMADAIRFTAAALKDCEKLILFNAAFDLTVMAHHFKLTPSVPVVDVQVLAFLKNPHAGNLDLKSLAEVELGMPPDERDDVRQWLIDQGLVKKTATRLWGAMICLAPGALVGKYAKGDTDRTWRLYRHLRDFEGKPAHRREQRLAPVLLDMERQGVPVSTSHLDRDKRLFTGLLDDTEGNIRKILKQKELDIGSPNDLADALESAFGIALPVTASGRRSTARDTIINFVPNKRLRALLMYRSSVLYALNNFLSPWLRAASITGGTIHPHWSSTRNDSGGARTSRLASSPNLQNLRGFEAEMKLNRDLARLWSREWRLPNVRSYIEAPRGMILVGRDWSQIELRMTAYYEQGILYDGYIANPKWDLHQWVVDTVKQMFGLDIGDGDAALARLNAKRVGFGIIYGAGGPGISRTTGQSLADAVLFKNTYLNAIPTLRNLIDDVKRVGRNGGYVTTIGGNEIHVAPPTIVNGERRTYEYKLLNYLIQGGAAELMKETMIEFSSRAEDGMRLLMSIHDEPVTLAPVAIKARAMKLLKSCMHELNPLVNLIDVPILSNGYYGRNFAETTDVK